MRWSNLANLESFSYVCGHCGESVASDKGFFAYFNGNDRREASIYICHKCKKPTYITVEEQVPGAKYGSLVSGLPADVNSLYEEARNAYSANAFSCVVMCCRKILMHVSVSQGALENKKFAYYVTYLSDNNIIPINAKDWVDEIRDLGNGSNHEIIINTPEEAEQILDFTEMLLKLVYEYPTKIKGKVQTSNTSPATVSQP